MLRLSLGEEEEKHLSLGEEEEKTLLHLSLGGGEEEKALRCILAWGRRERFTAYHFLHGGVWLVAYVIHSPHLDIYRSKA